MEHATIHRLLAKFHCLNDSDKDILNKLLEPRSGTTARSRLIEEGGANETIHVIQGGWAMRYKTLPDGRRQILNFLLPGDIFGLFGPLFEQSEFAVQTLTPVSLLGFSFSQMLDAFRESPRLALALTWLAGQDERQLDEQILRVGRRDARERMAHLFVELHCRLSQVGICGEQAQHFPLTQSVLADTLGMSHVHANRSLRALVKSGYVAPRNNGVDLLDVAGLAKLADFDSGYLEEVQVPAKTERAFPD